MPRVSRQQSASNRHAITEASARLIRERGIDGVSVSDAMSAAGLTHGGFYGHFDSKEALAAAACAHAFEQSSERWRRRIAGAGSGVEAQQALVNGYLSARSRDNPGTSCPAAALAGDVAREPANTAVRSAYVWGVRDLLDILTAVQHTGAPDSDRRAALAQFSTLCGAVVLSRATAGDPLSDEFLAAAREMMAPTPAPARAFKPVRRRRL